MSRGPRRSDAELLALVAEATRDLREARRELPAFDEDAFKDRVTRLMAACPDEELHDDVWDYREGKIDRFELRRRPAFRAAWAAELASFRAQLDQGRPGGG